MQNTAKARFSQLERFREPFLTRARRASKLTIPSLITEDSHTGYTRLYTPYQGMGARGVNNLAAKLTLALLPPNSPFFRWDVDDYTLEEMTQQEGMRAEVEEALGKIERAVMTEVETSALRVTAMEAVRHLLVGGNALLYLPEEGGSKMFALDRYVVKRDSMGTVFDIIVKETIMQDALPVEVIAQLTNPNPEQLDREVDLYTRVTKGEKKWEVYQEVEGIPVPDSFGTYPLDKCPWIPLRFTKIDGEDYGRGYVDEYYGDLRSLEALSQAIVEGSAAAAKVIFFVNPNGVTKQKTVAESPNGAVRAGQSQDISVLQMEKFNDFRVAMETMNGIEERLSFAFLLNSAVQRAGERVTAEEIRYMAQELEASLGGVYSILSVELQIPVVHALMHRLEKQKRVPKLPKDSVHPSITTGIDALGRGHDLDKLDMFLGGVLQTFGPEAVAEYIHIGDYLTRRATALGIDSKGLVKSEEELQQEREQAEEMHQQDQMQNMGGDMAKEVVKGAMK